MKCYYFAKVFAHSENLLFWQKRVQHIKIQLLPYVLGEVKVIDAQKKTATAIVVKSKIDMEIGNSVRFKRTNYPG